MPNAVLGPDGWTVGEISAVSGGGIEVADWASLLAIGSPTIGRTVTVRAALVNGGATGTQWQWSGSVWRPAGGQVLWASNVQVDGVAGGSASEQYLVQRQFPAGVFAGCRAIRLRARLQASAADTNARTLSWRFGPNGTTADPAPIVWAGLTASIRQIVFPGAVGVRSFTSLVGHTLSTNPMASPDFEATLGSAGNAALTTVSDLATQSIFVSLGVVQGASPLATISVTSASIYVE